MEKNVNPKVSVIMPVYNGADYIKESIESILGQTYKDFEFIIINDGSTDESEAKILSFKDSRIIYLKNECNLKLIKTLNKGLDIAQGKYIVRMDCDDISLPNRIQTQFDYMEKNPDIGVCGSNVEVFGEWNFNTDLSYSPEDINAELILKNPIFHPSVIIRKEVLDSNNIRYKSNFPHVEDYYLWVELAKHTKLVNLKEILLKYRWHDKNISVTQSDKQLEIVSDVIFTKLKEILQDGKYTEEQLKKNASLIYLQNNSKLKIENSEIKTTISFLKEIYDYLIRNNISSSLLKKYSAQLYKIVEANKIKKGYFLCFILTSPMFDLPIKQRLKLALNQVK